MTEKAKKEKKKAVKEAVRNASRAFVMNMYKLGYTFDQISQATKLNINEVKAIIEKNVH